MVSGPGLQQQLDQKVREIKQAVSGLSEEEASKPPAQGEWSAKEVLSHLSGSDSTEFVARLKRILDEDTPRIDVTPGVSYNEKRKGRSTSQLLSEVESAYGEAGKFLGGGGEQPLSRIAKVPELDGPTVGEDGTARPVPGL